MTILPLLAAGVAHAACTGASAKLPAPECEAWGSFYDSTGGKLLVPLARRRGEAVHEVHRKLGSSHHGRRLQTVRAERTR